MYEKQLFGRNVLYFQCAPPITALDDVSDEERPNKPFKGAQLWQCSVYYYWWAFLRENADYIACCNANGAGPLADLYKDFGDVRPDNFMGWWRKGGRLLFCEPPDEKIEVFLSPPTTHDNESRLLVSLPITGDIERTFAELRGLLKPIFQDARKKSIVSRARYPVHTKAVLTSLHQHLQVYQMKKADPSLNSFDIADRLSLLTANAKDEHSADERNRIAATISRYNIQAKSLIYNVACGRFPDFTKPPK